MNIFSRVLSKVIGEPSSSPEIPVRSPEKIVTSEEFAFELSGVIFKNGTHNKGENIYGTHDKDENIERNRKRLKALLAPLHDGEGLCFKYKSIHGKEKKFSFQISPQISPNLKINGDFNERNSSIKESWLPLFKSFEDVTFNTVPQETSVPFPIALELKPRSFVIPMKNENIGFLRSSHRKTTQIRLPFYLNKTPSFKLSQTGIIQTQDISLAIQIQKKILTPKDHALILEGLRSLHLQTNLIADEDLAKHLQAQLELFLTYGPKYFDFTVRVESNSRLSPSQLEMMAEEFMPFREAAWTEKPESEAFGLDLLKSAPRLSFLPPVFFELEESLSLPKIWQMPTDFELPGEGLLLGAYKSGVEETNVFLPEIDRACHTYIVGATGSGKSTLLGNMIIQDMKNGHGLCLIDPHGDLYDEVLRNIPEDRANDLVFFDPQDTLSTLALNVLATPPDLDKTKGINVAINSLRSMFDYLWNKEWTGPLFEQYFRNAILAIAESDTPGTNLVDVTHFLEDEDIREKILQRCTNNLVRSFWEKQADKARGDHELKNLVPWINCKINFITHSPILRPLLCCPNGAKFSFEEALEQRKIVLLNLSKGFLGNLESRIAGMVFLQKIFEASLSRMKKPVNQRPPFYIYIDEFQNFLFDNMATLVETRKYGVHLVLAHQNLNQLKSHTGLQKIKDLVLGNISTRIIFRVGPSDASELSSLTGFKESSMLQLKNYQAIISNPSTFPQPVCFNSLPLQSIPNSKPTTNKMIENSRVKFHSFVETIELMLENRRKFLLSPLANGGCK